MKNLPTEDMFQGKPRFSRRVVVGSLAALGASSFASKAFAHHNSEETQPEILVSGARQAPIPLLVSNFKSGIGGQIQEVILNDLNDTALFRALDGGKLPTTREPNLELMRSQGMRVAIAGEAHSSGGQLHVEFRLWNVVTGQQIQGLSYDTARENWRRVAHIIGDMVYEAMLGEKGYFDTRIAYIATTGSRGKPHKKHLAIMDQDGANAHLLTDGKWLTLEPRFNPVSNQIAFLSYKDEKPQVYLYDLQTGRERLLGIFDGISYAPRFSPDGKSIVLSVTTRDGGANIYVIDLMTRSKKRITGNASVIDTGPCFSPDGKQIVFISDRGGSPQLYIMPTEGGEATRISYGAGHYGSPVWSPKGDKIAFTCVRHGSFSIGLMDIDGRGERTLTEDYTLEAPTFSPNGRVLAFCRQNRYGGPGAVSRIERVSVDGTNDRIIPTPTLASDPSWSPFREPL